MQLVIRERFKDSGLALACKKHAVAQNLGCFQVELRSDQCGPLGLAILFVTSSQGPHGENTL